MTNSGLTIGQAAQTTGLSVDTLRYYEREGLLGPVARDTSGRRRYADDDLHWAGLVTCLREAGLGIADLRRFTDLLRSDHEPVERTEFLQRRRADLQGQVIAMQKAISVLDEKIAHYSNQMQTQCIVPGLVSSTLSPPGSLAPGLARSSAHEHPAYGGAAASSLTHSSADADRPCAERS